MQPTIQPNKLKSSNLLKSQKLHPNPKPNIAAGGEGTFRLQY